MVSVGPNDDAAPDDGGSDDGAYVDDLPPTNTSQGNDNNGIFTCRNTLYNLETFKNLENQVPTPLRQPYYSCTPLFGNTLKSEIGGSFSAVMLFMNISLVILVIIVVWWDSEEQFHTAFKPGSRKAKGLHTKSSAAAAEHYRMEMMQRRITEHEKRQKAEGSGNGDGEAAVEKDIDTNPIHKDKEDKDIKGSSGADVMRTRMMMHQRRLDANAKGNDNTGEHQL